jgi:Domain of unknown function (DUF6371)
MDHRFILEPYKGQGSRYMCPKCQHRRNTFKRYVDTETGEYLADHAGMCDRVESCSYHYPPSAYFKDNPDQRPAHGTYEYKRTVRPQSTKFDLLPWQLVQASMQKYGQNNFVLFLCKMFDRETANDLVNKYQIGTASHWKGATIFWQIDCQERLRAGKIMLYDVKNCKRVKTPYNHITWAHSLLSKDIKIKQCLFGEHLLPIEPYKVVAITESEKTAIIASIYYPNYIWLASGSLAGLSADKCKVLQNRLVLLYPDVNGYALWTEKAKELNLKIPSATFKVDHTLLGMAKPKDMVNGADIADRWIDEFLLQREIEQELKTQYN